MDEKEEKDEISVETAHNPVDKSIWKIRYLL